MLSQGNSHILPVRGQMGLTTLENNFTTPNTFATAHRIQTRHFYSEACVPGATHRGSRVSMFILAMFIIEKRRRKRETLQMPSKRTTNKLQYIIQWSDGSNEWNRTTCIICEWTSQKYIRPKITLLKGMPNMPLKIRKIHAIRFYRYLEMQ